MPDQSEAPIVRHDDVERILEKLERQLSLCSDSYEAPSGKIMLRVWITDMAAVLKLARAQIKGQNP